MSRTVTQGCKANLKKENLKPSDNLFFMVLYGIYYFHAIPIIKQLVVTEPYYYFNITATACWTQKYQRYNNLFLRNAHSHTRNTPFNDFAKWFLFQYILRCNHFESFVKVTYLSMTCHCSHYSYITRAFIPNDCGCNNSWFYPYSQYMG